MTKARDLANLISTGNPLADGAIAVAEVTGAAPLASPTFTGTLAAPTINASTALQIGGTAITVGASDINTVTAKAPLASPTFTGDVTLADKIVHASDTNTAIRFPANDTVAFETGGSERFRFASAGQLGIGGATYGTAGQVLSSGGASAAPTWADVGGGGSLTLLSTITASNSATVTFESGIDSTYYRYVIIGSGIYGSQSAGFGAQLKIGGSFQESTGSQVGYYYQHIEQNVGNGIGSSSFNAGVGPSGSAIANNLTAADIGTSATYPASIILEIDTPSANKYHAIQYNGIVQAQLRADRSIGGTFLHSTQGVLTGIRFKLGSGNLYGSFSLYGITK